MSYNRQLIDLSKWRPQEQLHIALADLDFAWFPAEVEKVQQLWQAGRHIADIAETIGRDPDEVALLLMDLARQDKLPGRKNGVIGGDG